jgi:hypothetical protein
MPEKHGHGVRGSSEVVKYRGQETEEKEKTNRKEKKKRAGRRLGGGEKEVGKAEASVGRRRERWGSAVMVAAPQKAGLGADASGGKGDHGVRV